MTSLQRLCSTLPTALRDSNAAQQQSNPAPYIARELSDAELTAVFARYGHLIRRWAERIFRDHATSDDVLHEVMLRLLRKGGSFVGLSSEAQKRQWLYRTTLRLCWDIKGRCKRDQDRAEMAASIAADGADMPMEERDALEILLGRLSVEERILAVLFFEEGYTKFEIHELFGRSRPFIDKKLGQVADELRRIQESIR